MRFLSAYVAHGRPLDGENRYTLLDGEDVLGEVTLNADDLFGDEATITVPQDRLRPGGELNLRLRSKNGKGIAAVVITYLATGPAIEKGGNHLDVDRTYYRLDPVEANGAVTWKRAPVRETVPTGTLLECEVTIRSSREREYVMVVDRHAGGFEPARDYGMRFEDQPKALDTQTQRYDDRTLFFITRLKRGGDHRAPLRARRRTWARTPRYRRRRS